MTVSDRVRECIAKHPDWSDSRVSSSIRGSTVSLIRAIREGKDVSENYRPPSTGTISLDMVEKRFDVISAIERELSKLPPGKLILERELCIRTVGNEISRFKRVLENNPERFKGNRVRLKINRESSESVWYWGSTDDISKAARLRDE